MTISLVLNLRLMFNLRLMIKIPNFLWLDLLVNLVSNSRHPCRTVVVVIMIVVVVVIVIIKVIIVVLVVDAGSPIYGVI